MIAAGRLREKVAMYRLTATSNGSGGFYYTQTFLLNTYASVVEVSSSPDLIAQGIKVKQVIKAIVRYRTDVTLAVGDYMEWRGNTFVLTNFKVDDVRTYIEMLLASEMDDSNRTQIGT